MGSSAVFFPQRGSWRKDVLLEITLMDKIFKLLTERPTMRSSISLVVMEGTVVSCFMASRVIHVCIQTLHPGLIFDGFEDVLDQELQRGEAVRYLVSSGLALLRVWEQLLLESTLFVSLEVNGGASVL